MCVEISVWRRNSSSGGYVRGPVRAAEEGMKEGPKGAAEKCCAEDNF